ncbi:MAG: hypothetical protein O3B01_11720 [Planctomycetota bacterium]|nr:hypothetical protein [Planctomycetota bacterium]
MTRQVNPVVFLSCFSCFSCFSWLSLCASALAAEPQTITIKDWTGRGFPPDLVSYAIDAPPDGSKSLRLLDADGKPVPANEPRSVQKANSYQLDFKTNPLRPRALECNAFGVKKFGYGSAGLYPNFCLSDSLRRRRYSPEPRVSERRSRDRHPGLHRQIAVLP